MLDVQSLRPEVVLLLDSFFHVVIWHGEMINMWKEQGYERSPEYANFSELLEVCSDILECCQMTFYRLSVSRLLRGMRGPCLKIAFPVPSMCSAAQGAAKQDSCWLKSIPQQLTTL